MPCCHPIVARGYSAGWDPRKADVHVIEATPGSTPSYKESEYLYINPDPQFLAISGNHTAAFCAAVKAVRPMSIVFCCGCKSLGCRAQAPRLGFCHFV